MKPQTAWRKRGYRILKQCPAYFLLIFFSVTFLLPVLWAILASLKSLTQVYTFPPEWWLKQTQWENYPRALSRLPFWRFLFNTLVLTVSTTAGELFTGAMVGYSFARLKWFDRDFWFIVLLGTMMLPAQVLLIPHYLINYLLGWIGTYKALLVPAWFGGSAFFIFLFRQFFRTIPGAYEESARLDGATEWFVFWKIMLPLTKPVLITVFLLSFIGHWKDVMQPLIYLNDFMTFPISLGLRMYQSLEGSWVNYLMAASIVTLTPLVILFFIGQRFLMKGMILS